MARKVRFDPVARAELTSRHGYILKRSGSSAIAEGYVRRIVAPCLKLSDVPHRGTMRNDIRPGSRLMGFERRATIAFVGEETGVTILGILYGGRDVGVLRSPSVTDGPFTAP